MPENYIFNKNVNNNIFMKVANISSKINYSVLNNILEIQFLFSVPINFLNVQEHSNFISLLDNINKQLSTDIVLKKENL